MSDELRDELLFIEDEIADAENQVTFWELKVQELREEREELINQLETE